MGLFCLVLLLPACQAEGGLSLLPPEEGDATPARPTGPQLDEVAGTEQIYDPPGGIPPGEPGRLIAAQPLDAGPGLAGWRVLYHSRALDGRDIAVSGLVLAPANPTGIEGRPVVAWAHGSVGLGDDCAPSRNPRRLLGQALVTDLLSRGYVVTATDYEGLGTPGPHPWLVGRSEGRSVLDSVRAAAQIPGTGAGSRFVAVGASQGGGAALFAGELSGSYAEELELLGVAAAAPAAELDLLALLPEEGPEGVAGFVVMGAFGFKAAYPHLDLGAVIAGDVVAQQQKVESLCQRDIDRRFAGYSVERLLVAPPGSVPQWAEVIVDNTPGGNPTPAPVLLVHGGDDPVVPPVISQLLHRRLCLLGVAVQRRVYDGVSHVGVMEAAGGDLLAWVDALSAGEDPPAVGQACG